MCLWRACVCKREKMFVSQSPLLESVQRVCACVCVGGV